jgi:hypothetical protein
VNTTFLLTVVPKGFKACSVKLSFVIIDFIPRCCQFNFRAGNRLFQQC